MNVSLTPYWESWIKERVDSGEYKTASEVVRAALRHKFKTDENIEPKEN